MAKSLWQRFPVGLLAVVMLALSVGHAPVFAAGEDSAEPHNESAGGGGDEAESHEPGGPIQWQTDLALWSLISFLVMFLILGKFAWRPLANGLDQRESRIRKDLADAETARLKAEQLLVEHEERLDQVQDQVRAILDEARRDAEQAKVNIMTEAQKEAEAMRKRAITDVNRAKDQAIDELFSLMASNVATATEYVLGRSVGGDDDNRLIEEALANLPRNGNSPPTG